MMTMDFWSRFSSWTCLKSWRATSWLATYLVDGLRGGMGVRLRRTYGSDLLVTAMGVFL